MNLPTLSRNAAVLRFPNDFSMSVIIINQPTVHMTAYSPGQGDSVPLRCPARQQRHSGTDADSSQG